MPRSPSIVHALTRSLRAAPPGPGDAATVALARRYAQTIEDAYGEDGELDVLTDLGPKLLAVLDALGLTPKARAVKRAPGEGGGDDRPAAVRTLEELRAARRDRT
mgnify:CR=1 FL=1